MKAWMKQIIAGLILLSPSVYVLWFTSPSSYSWSLTLGFVLTVFLVLLCGFLGLVLLCVGLVEVAFRIIYWKPKHFKKVQRASKKVYRWMTTDGFK